MCVLQYVCLACLVYLRESFSLFSQHRGPKSVKRLTLQILSENMRQQLASKPTPTITKRVPGSNLRAYLMRNGRSLRRPFMKSAQMVRIVQAAFISPIMYNGRSV